MKDGLMFVLGFSAVFLFLIGIYELSFLIWPDEKLCDWEIQEVEERGWT